MKLGLCFDDVLLEPKYSDIKSRKEINIGNSLSDTLKLDCPIISAPMDTVTEDGMSIAIRTVGGLGIVHRYNTIEEQFMPYTWQRGVVESDWGSVKDRKVAKVDDEVIGIDVVIGRVTSPNAFQRMVKVMSPECVSYFIAFPKLSRKEMKENQKQTVEQ